MRMESVNPWITKLGFLAKSFQESTPGQWYFLICWFLKNMYFNFRIIRRYLKNSESYAICVGYVSYIVKFRKFIFKFFDLLRKLRLNIVI